jgi:ubiquinone/menaquinone biosynthesis C-methylase UbiE
MDKRMKLENPARVAELDPEGTLHKLGLKAGDIFCDIGAGSGLFTLPAARMTGAPVYALETDEAMLSLIRERADAESLDIRTVRVTDAGLGIPEATADVVLLATVLHEIPNKHDFLTNVYRLLRESGRVAVIEFREGETSMGPNPSHRMSREHILSAMRDVGMQLHMEYILGPNFYCLVFQKSA